MNSQNAESKPGNSQASKTKNQNKQLLQIIFWIVGVTVALCALALVGILYNVWRPYVGPRVQIILEPDYSRVSTVDPSDLESTVEILNARCRALGCGARFQIAANNQIIAQVPTSADIESLAGKMVAVGLLEFVDFGTTPILPGTTIATDYSYGYFPQVEGNQWHTIMTNGEFESVYVTNDSMRGNVISFTLTSKGTKIFSDYTAGNVGHYLGIVLDKVVLSSPQVNAPITNGSGIIQGSFTKQDAENLAAYLKVGTPLPIPLVVTEISQNGK